MKTLIVVESPTKAATIQKYAGDDYIVVATMGHIVDLAKGGNKGIGVDVNNDFKPYYAILKDKIEILDNIIQQAEKSDEILLASDNDREGEGISYHLKNKLASTGKPIKRIGFNEITKSAIAKAIATPRDIDINLFHSQEARRILDRIVGFMVSPYLINTYGQNLSAGRVQSVAVRMIIDREKDIDTFTPEEFWNIYCKFFTPTKEQLVMKYNGRPTNEDAAKNIVNEIKKQQEFYVKSIVSQKKKEKPCAPLITASLQQYMAKKHSFEPDKTMKIAQSLYEIGYISYIRTDSTRISDDAIILVRNWIKENGFDVPKKPQIYKTKSSAQDAHECIRPTNIKNAPSETILTGDEKEVYTAIWKHFVASQMESAIWNTMQVRVCARGNDKLIFNASGKALESKGFLEIFGDVDPGKIDIPNLTENMVITLSDTKADQKFTQPPPRYNDATILEELEKKQIGRPATTAEIIKKITGRNYVEKVGNTYRPTELGKKITDVLVKLFSFMDYDYTASLERKLDDIANGNINSINMLKEFFVPFKNKLDQAYLNSGCDLCELCRSPMIIRTAKNTDNKFYGCSQYPRCRNTKPFEMKTN
jgi:DNA topoisomerase I